MRPVDCPFKYSSLLVYTAFSKNSRKKRKSKSLDSANVLSTVVTSWKYTKFLAKLTETMLRLKNEGVAYSAYLQP